MIFPRIWETSRMWKMFHSSMVGHFLMTVCRPEGRSITFDYRRIETVPGPSELWPQWAQRKCSRAIHHIWFYDQDFPEIIVVLLGVVAIKYCKNLFPHTNFPEYDRWKLLRETCMKGMKQLCARQLSSQQNIFVRDFQIKVMFWYNHLERRVKKLTSLFIYWTQFERL